MKNLNRFQRMYLEEIEGDIRGLQTNYIEILGLNRYISVYTIHQKTSPPAYREHNIFFFSKVDSKIVTSPVDLKLEDKIRAHVLRRSCIQVERGMGYIGAAAIGVKRRTFFDYCKKVVKLELLSRGPIKSD
ncbi:hypothetical protein ACFLZZ_00775 [Nanoarchaeota archaeon]